MLGALTYVFAAPVADVVTPVPPPRVTSVCCLSTALVANYGPSSKSKI